MHNQASDMTTLQITAHNTWGKKVGYSTATQIWEPCTL